MLKYLSRGSKQFLQNLCPQVVCHGSMKTFLQIGQANRSSSRSTNLTSDSVRNATHITHNVLLEFSSFSIFIHRTCFISVPGKTPMTCVHVSFQEGSRSAVLFKVRSKNCMLLLLLPRVAPAPMKS